MATTTLLAQSTETWVYPVLSYTALPDVGGGYRPRNTWVKGHSNSKHTNNRYQGGTEDTSGKYNGNMMSHFHFSVNGKSMKTFIRELGGADKITSIKLRFTCGHSWYSYMDLRICLGPYWDTSPYKGKTVDSYSDNPNEGLGIKHILSTNINKGQTKTFDLTAYKNHIANYETITIYAPGAYNVPQYYGWIYGHSNSNVSNRPELTISYNTNTAPRTPGVTVNTPTDGYGYIKPNLDVSVINNGDPDNNIHSAPYALQLRNQNGTLFKQFDYQASNRFTYDLSSYRGQSVSIRGLIRDTESLVAYTDKTVYINSKPYWTDYKAENIAINYTSGVVNNVYKQNITFNWPRATDAQPQHNSNMKYDIFYHIGTLNGTNVDMTYSNSLERGYIGNSYTLDATRLNNININKGERICFSVWASDSFELSDYRILSNWIYREQPPTSPTNVAPRSGHYESNVNVSWASSSSSNGSYVEKYKICLIDKNDNIKKTYYSTSTSFTCNDINIINRGDTFKFSVVAIDNLGNNSSIAYSGILKRNSAPTDPKNFKINSSSIYVKNNVNLTWNASTDIDGDAIKYNIYYSLNNGLFNSLVKGLSSTNYNHNISSLSAGTTINYYIEAYDTFNIYSNKVYIATKPQINMPPSNPSIILPYSNRIIYSNIPRIIFKVGSSNNNNQLKVIITINNKEYRSDKDINYFNKTSYNNNEEGVFVIPDNIPLNYIDNNKIAIKTYDNIDYSNVVNSTIACQAVTVNRKNTGDKITATDINNLKAMINANRFAYGLKEYNWIDGFLEANRNYIYKKYFEQMIEGIFEVNNYLNNKSNLKRIYTKDVINNNSIINKNIINNLINIIKKY